MAEDIFEMTDPEILRDFAIKQLDSVTNYFSDKKLDLAEYYNSARNIWTNVNRNPILKGKIDKAINQQRMAVHQMAAIDISNGDPIRKRYDPNEWLKNIPPELADKKDVYLKDKVTSLLNLIKGLT